MTKPMLLGVADALIISLETGVQMYSASLSSHTIEQSVDVTDLRGGRGNKIIGRLKTNKGLSVTLEDLQQTKEMQALISGGKITEGTMSAYMMPKEVSYTTDGLLLDGSTQDNPTPKKPNEIPCVNAETGAALVGEWNGGDNKLVLKVANPGGVAGAEIGNGTKVLLGGYEYDAQTEGFFKINSTKFADNVAVVLEEDVYNGENMQIIGVKQTIIPVASPDENFSLSGSAEISETTASYTFTALANGECGDLGYVVYLPYNAPTC